MSDYLIHGRIATNEYEASKDLYRHFTKGFIKGYIKIREYYIGPEALKLSEKVRMITISVNEPLEYDLKITNLHGEL